MGVVLMSGFRFTETNSRFSMIPGSAAGTRFERADGWSPNTFSVRHLAGDTWDGSGESGKIVLSGFGNSFSIGFSLFGEKLSTATPNVTTAGFVVWDGPYRQYGFSLLPGYPVLSATNLDSGLPPLQSRSPTVISGGWQWINVVGKLKDPTTGFFRIYRNSELLAEVVGDTEAAPPYDVSRFEIYVGNCNGTSGIRIGDLIVRDDTTVIPASRVDVLLPDGTTSAGWSGSDGNNVDNHLLVDDPGPLVTASDYVQSTTVGATDTYTVPDLTFTPSAVHAVQVEAVCSRPTGGTGSLAVMVNGTEGAALDPGNGGIVHHVWGTNPSGGAAWTKAAVDAMNVGVRVKS